MKKSIVFVCLCLGAVIFTAAVWSQTSSPESKLAEASYGLFLNDVDYYHDVNYWNYMELNKGFGFISGSRKGDEGGFAGGFATKIKGLYVSLFVDGRFWQGQAVDIYDGNDRRDPIGNNGDTDNTNNTGAGYPATANKDEAVKFDSQWSVLIGGGFGGVKVWVDFDDTAHDYDLTTKDPANNNDEHEYTYDTGNVGIGVEYGKNLEKARGIYEIFAGLSYTISLDGETDKVDGDIKRQVYGRDKLSIYGGTSIPLKEDLLAGVEAAFDIGIQRHPYDYKNEDVVKFTGYDVGAGVLGYINKSLTLTEQLSLAMQMDLNLYFNWKRDKYSREGYPPPNTSYDTQGQDIHDFYLAPSAEVALKYKFEKPFELAAGLQYASLSDNFYEVNTIYDGDARIITQDFNPMQLALSLAGAWTPSSTFTLEGKIEALPFYESDPNNTRTNTASFGSGMTYKGKGNVNDIPLEFSLLASLKF